MVDSSVAVGGGPTGSSSSSVAEWKLLSSLGGAGESSVVVSYGSGNKVIKRNWSVCTGYMILYSPTKLYKSLYCFNVLKQNCIE